LSETDRVEAKEVDDDEEECPRSGNEMSLKKVKEL
jgi:hypothetical protein